MKNILNPSFSIPKKTPPKTFFNRVDVIPVFLVIILSIISIFCFYSFYVNKLGLSYNDARSHLDIGRRVVEGLKPGLAQIGSVWLPLPHLLMVPTVWNDFMWHTGLAGALPNMVSYIATSIIIYAYLSKLGVRLLGRLVGVLVFAINLNVLYLQSTAMTEPLLMATMTAGCFYLLVWSKNGQMVDLIKSAAWIMLSTLTRYDGWFLAIVATGIITIKTAVTEFLNRTREQSLSKRLRAGYSHAEGVGILFMTLAFFGIALWFLWNLLIFKDPFYFASGPFSAKSQQDQLYAAGNLPTKHNLMLSIKMYTYATVYNSGTFLTAIGLVGGILLWTDKRLSWQLKLATLSMLTPFVFNVISLFLGQSVIFVQGLSGNTWFNIRYGILMLPSIAIGIGYLIDKLQKISWPLIAVIVLSLAISLTSADAVTIDDARVGSSQKNVSEVSGYLADHAKNQKGFILISVASHDAILFSSGLPMARYIHEGTGAYWESAIVAPDRWARWIIMRTNDENDLTWRSIKNAPGLVKYEKVGEFPFADIYKLKDEFLFDLNTEPVYSRRENK